MSPENAEFLAYLRELVIADDKENEPNLEDLCAEHKEHAIAELTLNMWAMGLQQDEPSAVRVLSEPRGPLLPEYWADRPWPPENPRDVWDDLGRWGRTQGVLERLRDQ